MLSYRCAKGTRRISALSGTGVKCNGGVINYFPGGTNINAKIKEAFCSVAVRPYDTRNGIRNSDFGLG